MPSGFAQFFCLFFCQVLWALKAIVFTHKNTTSRHLTKHGDCYTPERAVIYIEGENANAENITLCNLVPRGKHRIPTKGLLRPRFKSHWPFTQGKEHPNTSAF